MVNYCCTSSLEINHWNVHCFTPVVYGHRDDQVEAQYMYRTNIRRVNTLRPRQHGCHFPDDIFKCIFLNENVWISIKISLEFVPKGPINNISALVQIMAWRRPGNKLLFEPMMVSPLTHIWINLPQFVKQISAIYLLMISMLFSSTFSNPTIDMLNPQIRQENYTKIENKPRTTHL